MTIKQRVPAQQPQQQRTQATSYYDKLKERFETQQQLRIPRSEAAWSAEEGRLGSWNSGVGRLYASGAAMGYDSGEGRPVFRFDPDEVDPQNRRTSP